MKAHFFFFYNIISHCKCYFYFPSIFLSSSSIMWPKALLLVVLVRGRCEANWVKGINKSKKGKN